MGELVGRRVKMILGPAFDGWRPGVKEGGVYYDGDPSTQERALIVAGARPAEDGRDLGREKRVLLSVQHANLLRLLSLALAPGSREPVFAYAFHEGVSLSRLIRALRAEGGLLPWGVAASVVGAVARGAQEVLVGAGAYPGFGLFHVGPTPDDILIDDRGRVRASGFEIWKEGSLPQSAPGYGPPEAGLGSAGLVYSLGALLVEMLCGERPPGASRAAARHRELVRRVQVKVLARPGDRLPESLVDIVAECLDAEPMMRPTMLELARRLDELVTRAPGPTIDAWSTRVVVAYRAGEALTQSVMAVDPRLGMASEYSDEDLDPEARPTTIDPSRALRKAQLGGRGELDLAGRDSMHGLISAAPERRRHRESLYGLYGDQSYDSSAELAAGDSLLGQDMPEPVPAGAAAHSAGEDLPQESGWEPELPSPSAVPGPAIPSGGAEAVEPPPLTGSSPVVPPAPEEPAPPPPPSTSRGSSPVASGLGFAAMLVLAVGIGWMARGVDPAPASPVAPATAPVEAATPSAVAPAPPGAPSVPPPSAEPTPAAPAPAPAKPAARQPRSAPSASVPPAAPAAPAVPEASASSPEPAPPAAPEPPSAFTVVFRSADPSIASMAVKCHTGLGSGTSEVIVSDASPGPCRVTATRDGGTVQAVVPVSGPRTYTCFGGGSRGCR